jgi:subtilisin family serine protease
MTSPRIPTVLAIVGLMAGGSAALALQSAQPATPPAPSSGKIVVKTADDLPRRTYPITGKALDIINDPARLNPIVDALIADTLSDLDKYEITDASTLRGYYDVLSQAYSLKGDLDKAIAFSDKARDTETKEQEKIMRGQALRARAAALKVSKDLASPAFQDAFKADLRARMRPLPYDIIKDRLIAVRNQAKIVNRGLIESSLSTTLDPLIAAANGQAGAEIAAALIQAKNTLDTALPLIPAMAEVYAEIIDAHANAGVAASKWDTRLVTLAAADVAKPVVVAVWDSGVDVSLYPDNLWTNPAEQLNGKDDDANGFVDDVHGIAFSLDRKPAVGPLASLDGLKGDKNQYIDFIAASQDMQAGVTNDGVTRFQEYYKNLRGDALRDFSDDLNLMGGWAHGTHVAGIVVAGNPGVRLLHITENWPWKSIPDEAPTVELGKRWGENCKQTVAYLKKANVRVVNMSWRIPRAAFEGMLAAKGVGATTEERAELSRQIFKPFRDGLEEAIRSAPEILFIAGSGNEDNDIDFAEYVPAGLRLPNLLTVGAVDDQDRFTTFTSTGKSVELYANGYRIPSFVPGGRTIPFSGTSMASPQVANLAAKLLALHPELTPADVIAKIRAGADPIPDQPDRFIINPARTIGAVRSSK